MISVPFASPRAAEECTRAKGVTVYKQRVTYEFGAYAVRIAGAELRPP